jgi:hypothetical protein
MSPHASHHRPGLTGFWIAFADDRETVLARGNTAAEVFKKAQKKSPETLIITHVLPEDDEIPNDDLIAAMKAADEEERSGKLIPYETVAEVMAALA